MHHGKFYKLVPVINLDDGTLVGYDIHAVHESSGTDILPESFCMPAIPDDFSSSLYLPLQRLSSQGMHLHIRFSVWALAKGIRHIKTNGSAIRMVASLRTGLLGKLTIYQRRVLEKNLKELVHSGYDLWVTGRMPEILDECGKLSFPIQGIKFHRDTLLYGTWYLRELHRSSKAYAPVILMDGIDTEDMLLRARMCGAHYGQGKLWEDMTLFYRDGHCISESAVSLQE